jgi:CubicO group peptidase (beta-lactamase class C family)
MDIMTPITRRACLKKAGLSLVGLTVPPWLGLQPSRAAVAESSDTALSPAFDVPAAVSAYQLQTPHRVLQMDVTAGTWLARFTQLANQGYRPIWIQGSTNGGAAATYSAIWIRDARPGWYEWQDMDASAYQNNFDSYANSGYRPISVSGYQSGGVNRFAAIWIYDPGGVAYAGTHNATGAQYQTFVNDMIAAAYMPQVVDGYAAGGDDYISIWAKTPAAPWVARHGMTSAQYQSEFVSWANQGYRVTCLSAYQISGATYFAAYWVKDGVTDSIGNHDWLPASLYNNAVTQEHNDFQPIVIEGYDTGSTRNFAAVWIRKPRTWTTTGAFNPSLSSFDTTVQAFMQARGIRGGALAVTKDSRLVYARGYRWDGSTVDNVNPDSLFRIASLSKPLTSMAIMRLVQEGRLHLGDRLTTLLGATLPAPLDARMNDITVLNLLQHTGGWNRDITFDPMFIDQTIAAYSGAALPVSRQQIMNYMTATQFLSFAPGTQMNYSNYGYLLLGRIIEAVTGLPYVQYMQSAVLGPLGISRMVLGSSEFEYRKSTEVKYFTGDPGLYGNMRQAGAPGNAMASYGSFNLENMDAHGGWLASAIDLACFCTAFDSTGLFAVLNQTSVNQTFAVPSIGINPDGSWYGCGWAVRTAGSGRNTWHNGSLPGTSTLMVRRVDGLNWAVVFNQRDDPSGLNYGDIDGALHTAANAVTTWPAGDLFPNYALPLRHQGFSDDPLISGVTTVKSVHLNELRSRIDWARARRGLPPYGYSDAISPGTAIKVSHVTDCRTALAAVYLALSQPAPTYTDVNLVAGMSIRAVHVAELRTAVRAVE